MESGFAISEERKREIKLEVLANTILKKIAPEIAAMLEARPPKVRKQVYLMLIKEIRHWIKVINVLEKKV